MAKVCTLEILGTVGSDEIAFRFVSMNRAYRECVNYDSTRHCVTVVSADHPRIRRVSGRIRLHIPGTYGMYDYIQLICTRSEMERIGATLKEMNTCANLFIDVYDPRGIMSTELGDTPQKMMMPLRTYVLLLGDQFDITKGREQFGKMLPLLEVSFAKRVEPGGWTVAVFGTSVTQATRLEAKQLEALLLVGQPPDAAWIDPRSGLVCMME